MFPPDTLSGKLPGKTIIRLFPRHRSPSGYGVNVHIVTNQPQRTTIHQFLVRISMRYDTCSRLVPSRLETSNREVYITLAGFHKQLCNAKCKSCSDTKYVAFFVDLLSWDEYCLRHVEKFLLDHKAVERSYLDNETWMTYELLDQKPVFQVEGVELVCTYGAFDEVPLPENS